MSTTKLLAAINVLLVVNAAACDEPRPHALGSPMSADGSPPRGGSIADGPMGGGAAPDAAGTGGSGGGANEADSSVAGPGGNSGGETDAAPPTSAAGPPTSSPDAGVASSPDAALSPDTASAPPPPPPTCMNACQLGQMRCQGGLQNLRDVDFRMHQLGSAAALPIATDVSCERSAVRMSHAERLPCRGCQTVRLRRRTDV